MKDYLEFEFFDNSTVQHETMIAFLSELGFEGFEEEGTVLRAYIREDQFNQQAFDETLQHLQDVAYTRSVVAQVNWNQQWEEQFQPVIIEDFAAIRAHFHQPITNVLHELVITPKMSFGTGHHATTYMMIQLMKEVNFSAKKVIDFGTGTGVLAILAEKLGAQSVLAIDNDEWSIENSRENIEQNHCSKIDIVLADELIGNQSHDVIIANINLNIILASLPAIYSIAKPDAPILLSGFLATDELALRDALAAHAIDVVKVLHREGWIAVLAHK
jgi:ribosomal protein L11 methyltransferase